MSVDTRARILVTTEALLRRHGIAKVSVSDVARELGMSHSNVYKHFASKSALFEAIGAAWLQNVATGLNAIATSPIPAPRRLETWVLALADVKRTSYHADPAMFDTYRVLVENHGGAVGNFVEALTGQVTRMLLAGVADGDYCITDVDTAALAVMAATAGFRHPSMIHLNRGQPMDNQIHPVMTLLNAALARGAL